MRIRYYKDMVSRIIFLGVCVMGVAALGSLGFFIFLVNPDYLGFSGFLLFYLSLLAAVWSLFFILGERWLRQHRGKWRYALARRSALGAIVVTGSVTFAQMGFFSGYALLALCGAALIAEYWFARR